MPSETEKKQEEHRRKKVAYITEREYGYKAFILDGIDIEFVLNEWMEENPDLQIDETKMNNKIVLVRWQRTKKKAPKVRPR